MNSLKVLRRFSCFCEFQRTRAPHFDFSSANASFLTRREVHYPTSEFAVKHKYDDDSEDEFLSYLERDATRPYLDKWKLKLGMLKNSPKLEITTTESKDIKCYQALNFLSKQMGLFCQMYGKTIVFSKVSLPNYRPDLDRSRPQRQVYVSQVLLAKVRTLLEEHLRTETPIRVEPTKVATAFTNSVANTSSETCGEDPYGSIDKLLLDAKRNKQMYDRQSYWQSSREGQMVLAFRNKLPAAELRAVFIDSLRRYQVLIVSGETGCGKTTQLPQYILEHMIDSGAGTSCNIVCTQPRRISAASVAERVADERGEKLGESVGYQVRFDVMKGKSTNMLFCTTGILLRRLMMDPALKGVSHVVVDEIHERGLNEDFLLIVLRDVIRRRPDLKLIVMSATLNAEMFSTYFPGAGTLYIPGFTYPVKSYFLEEVLQLTGYKLKTKSKLPDHLELISQGRSDGAIHPTTDGSGAEIIDFYLVQAMLVHICTFGEEGAVLVFMTGWEDISSLKRLLQMHRLLGDPQRVLLLGCHSTMSADEQRLIFEHPPPHIRKIILSTNIAETSITVNDVSFVVDLGRAKSKSYDVLTSTSCLLPNWISKASAIQRKGRAGRVKPGVCYHLYPKKVYDCLEEQQEPEILRVPLHTICLHIKSLQLGGICEFLSKAIQPPEQNAIQNAVEFLKIIGALNENEELTLLGRHLSMLPVEPQIGKMLIMGCVLQCLDPILTIAAGLSARDPFVVPLDRRKDSNQSKYNFSAGEMSDHIAYVRAYNDWELAMKHGTASDFCWTHFLSMQCMMAMTSIRKQFMGLLKDAGFLDVNMANCDKYASDPMLVRAVLCAGLFPGISSVVITPVDVIHKTIDGNEVMVHPNSVNAKQEGSGGFPWLVFLEKVKTSRTFIRDSTGVSDSTLLLFGGKLISSLSPGHLCMCGQCLEFFMLNEVKDMFVKLRGAVDRLIHKKLANPEVDIYKEGGGSLMKAVLELLRGDVNGGCFVYGRDADGEPGRIVGSLDAKNQLKEALLKEGLRSKPQVSCRKNKAEQFVCTIEFRGLKFIGVPAKHKKQAERNTCAEVISWLADPLNAEEKKKMIWGTVKRAAFRIKIVRHMLKRVHPMD